MHCLDNPEENSSLTLANCDFYRESMDEIGEDGEDEDDDDEDYESENDEISFDPNQFMDILKSTLGNYPSLSTSHPQPQRNFGETND
jgi:hypothetical protein